MNTVVAKVHNNGDRLAKGVVVDIFAVEFTTGTGRSFGWASPRRTAHRA